MNAVALARETNAGEKMLSLFELLECRAMHPSLFQKNELEPFL